MDPELLKKLNKRKQADDDAVLQSPGASGGYLNAPSSQQFQLNSNNNNSNASSSNDGKNEILLDDITFPTPPLGKPHLSVVDTDNVDIDLPLGRPPPSQHDDVEEEEEEGSIGDEFRKLVEKLVRQGKFLLLYLQQTV